MAKNGRLELGNKFYKHCRSVAIVTYLASKAIDLVKKTQNTGYYAVQGHSRSSRKPVCDFLLVIHTN